MWLWCLDLAWLASGAGFNGDLFPAHAVSIATHFTFIFGWKASLEKVIEFTRYKRVKWLSIMGQWINDFKFVTKKVRSTVKFITWIKELAKVSFKHMLSIIIKLKTRIWEKKNTLLTLTPTLRKLSQCIILAPATTLPYYLFPENMPQLYIHSKSKILS